MGKRDKRVDAYIAKSANFAKPILTHLRELIHQGCPEVVETIKWGFPNFDYHGIMCSMAAFKEHCSFGFWKSAIMSDPDKIFSDGAETAMGSFGKLQELGQLPPAKIMVKYIKEAARLNEEGVKLPRKVRTAVKKELVVPDYLHTALRKNKKAMQTFEGFTYSHKKEYVEWVTEAKTEETREKRLATTLEWLAEGKARNWKYAKK